MNNEILDRHGRPLTLGDLVVCTSPDHLNWEVRTLRPLVDANAPPGFVEVQLVTSLRMQVPAGQSLVQVQLVLSRAERELRQAGPTLVKPS